MFLDPSSGRCHVQLSCELRPPQAMIATTQAYWLRMLMPALGRIPRVFTCGRRMPGTLSLQQAKVMPCLETIHPCSSNDPALITFTSGTGGMPKAALRTHGFLLAQYRALQASLELSAGQVDLSTLPIFVLANLASGLTSLIPNVDLRRPKSVDAARVVQQVTDHRVTRAGGSPAFFQQLIAHGTRAGITP
ncbi:AMP-binding protein, partial [Limnoraphis robusta CCNP1324]|uniref:AMP-binding protein n=1 Tax=Limnoraphis robusta TaxID=1118279 RepID=UPI002B1F1669